MLTGADHESRHQPFSRGNVIQVIGHCMGSFEGWIPHGNTFNTLSSDPAISHSHLATLQCDSNFCSLHGKFLKGWLPHGNIFKTLFLIHAAVVLNKYTEVYCPSTWIDVKEPIQWSEKNPATPNGLQIVFLAILTCNLSCNALYIGLIVME